MLKNIAKSNVQQRSFKVYKKFYASEGDYPVIKLYDKSSALHAQSGSFDANTFERTISGSIIDSYHKHPMYKSIRHKYFIQNDLVKMFGPISNLYDFSNERRLEETIYVIDIDQIKYGEGIKPSSISLTSPQIASGSEVTDDGKGVLRARTTEYQWTRMDMNQFQNNFSKGVDIVFVDNNTQPITIRAQQPYGIDFNNPLVKLTWEGDTDDRTIQRMDAFTDTLQTGSQGQITIAEGLNFLGSGLENVQIGNVFYADGLIVFTTLAEQEEDVTDYDLEYRSTKTIHELEVLCQAGDCEFNYSQNPSAIDVTVSGSYTFRPTPTGPKRFGRRRNWDSEPIRIKEITTIDRTAEYYGSVTSSETGDYVTGSWDDYYNYSLTDPTGSYLTTFVSTIGLYDDNNNMVAVAKLPQPIKKYPDMAVNFIVRMDL
jgi:hypothetical protein